MFVFSQRIHLRFPNDKDKYRGTDQGRDNTGFQFAWAAQYTAKYIGKQKKTGSANGRERQDFSHIRAEEQPYEVGDHQSHKADRTCQSRGGCTEKDSCKSAESPDQRDVKPKPCGGIIAERHQDVVEALAKEGFYPVETVERKGWVAITLKKAGKE